jgi:tripartite-type tricarboxylate transporter receptor subunit TctC
MRLLKLASLALAAGMSLALSFAAPALAAWPNDKQVTIVTPWPAGSGIDIFCRIVAEELSKKWNAQVIVESRAGASGNIGTAFVARQPADGYTFIVSTPGPAANNMLTFKNLPYNPLTDFTNITQLTEDLMVVITGPRIAHIKTLKEFLDYAKANPGKLQLGHSGVGTYAHMIQLAMQDALGTTFNLVPYKGAAQMMQDMLSGNIDAVVNFPSAFSEQIKAGKLQALGIVGENRSDLFPGVPTLKETGVNFSASPWYSMQAPKGLPRPIVDATNKAVREILADPAIRAKMLAANINPKTGTPEDLDKLIKNEIEKWRPVVKKYNITSE